MCVHMQTSLLNARIIELQCCETLGYTCTYVRTISENSEIPYVLHVWCTAIYAYTTHVLQCPYIALHAMYMYVYNSFYDVHVCVCIYRCIDMVRSSVYVELASELEITKALTYLRMMDIPKVHVCMDV